jgi:hypothetical protein
MEITRDKIIGLLYESITELNEQRSKDQQLECLPQTPLGERAGLDSLGFVNFITLVEEKCQSAFGRSLMLANAAETLSGRDPFDTVSTLAEFIELGLTDGFAAWR